MTENNEPNDTAEGGDEAPDVIGELLTTLDKIMAAAEEAGGDCDTAMLVAGSKAILGRSVNKAFQAAADKEWIKAAQYTKQAIETLAHFGEWTMNQAGRSGQVPTVNTKEGEAMLVVMDPEGNVVDGEHLPELVQEAMATLAASNLDDLPDGMVGVKVSTEDGTMTLVDEDGDEHPFPSPGATGEARRAKRGNPMPGGYL